MSRYIGVIPQYIGVTGFTTPAQLSEVYSASGIGKEVFLGEEHEMPHLMAGVLANRKTLHGEEPGNRRYPPASEIEEIFLGYPGVLNLIHYNSRSTGDELLQELCAIREYGGNPCCGLQLNMAFPSREVLSRYRGLYLADEIILQANSGVLASVDNNPDTLAAMVASYFHEDLCSGILLDRSGGEGKPMNLAELRCFVEALRVAGVTEGVGVAGGLSAQNVGMLEPLLKDYPYLSIDAEGALHVGEKKDVLDTSLAVGYVLAALDVMFYAGTETI